MNTTDTSAAMTYTFPGGHKVSLEVVARFQLSPDSFDNGIGSLILGQTPTGFVLFVEGGYLPNGEARAEFSDQRTAYEAALKVAATMVEDWLDTCDELNDEGVQS